MATTVRSSHLNISITEKLKLNGTEHGSTKSINISSINEVSKRVFTIATTPGTQIYAGGSTASNGTFVTDNVKYIRITNLDDTNFVVLHLEGSSHYAQLKIEPGRFFILTDVSLSFDGANAVSGYTPVSITKIDAMADTASCDIEVFVASS